jgi:hypothetical protein
MCAIVTINDVSTTTILKWYHSHVVTSTSTISLVVIRYCF